TIGLAIQSDGKIVTAGLGPVAGNSERDFIMTRYNNDTAPTLHPATVQPGNPFTFKFPSAARDTTYLDIRFRGPESLADQVAMNWQRGVSAEHTVPGDMVAGAWMLTGVRSHDDPNNHGGDFTDVSLSLVVQPLPSVAGLKFDPAGVHVGSSFMATFSGTN